MKKHLSALMLVACFPMAALASQKLHCPSLHSAQAMLNSELGKFWDKVPGSYHFAYNTSFPTDYPVALIPQQGQHGGIAVLGQDAHAHFSNGQLKKRISLKTAPKPIAVHGMNACVYAATDNLTVALTNNF